MPRNSMKERNMITSWLEENGDPEIEKYIETNLVITEKVHKAMERKGWKTEDLAVALGKSPSEVSKWLSGMHNFTLRNIVKMEVALGIHIDGLENTAANDSLCAKTLSASILAKSGG